ncbi:PREDICTED: uncharacterized protein LOC109180086 [Ipomoea nil]|uniref:uncharacterized protein LOC109180086 n=1 Tax=Ipomoea nil TaxID=35883 RepID=UPI000901F90F|nr:PREDICTED: uncharacterized protein LOC109180086 [Ipomoea nil]XP_019185137.1 PREDICTED: uncharacterized protein LOC109180086 [Ipomoea nil]
MKKMNLLLRKCKSLSRQLGRTSSYSSLRSRSTRDEDMLAAEDTNSGDNHEECEKTVVVGSSRRRYHISSKHLSHPLMNALIQKSKQQQKKKKKKKNEEDDDDDLSVKCEVVLFDHLLWMLENAYDEDDDGSLEELADLYVV